jgi:hypothetical protein
VTAAAVDWRAWPEEAKLALVRRLELEIALEGREPLETGPLGFGERYCPHLISGARSPLHEHLNAWHVAEATRPPGALEATAAPRGHGKTTAGVEVAALWHAAHKVRRFVVIASDTYSQAVQRIATITTEIEQNDELRAAFPDLRPARDGQGNLVAWRDDELALANGVRILGVGAGKSIRGAKDRENRPDLLLLDDLEDEASVATPEALAKRLRWITRTALALAGPMRGISALWVGTILSRSALLNQATGAALEQGQHRPAWARAWHATVFRAELEGSERLPAVVTDPETGETVFDEETGEPVTFEVGEPLWSELTREDLASIRYRIGSVSYAAEYLSDPVDDATTLLAPPHLAVFLNPTAPPLARLVQLPGGRIVPVASMTRAAALDPQYALPQPGKGEPDLAAIVVAGAYGGDTFLLDSWIGRDRHGQASRLVELAVSWSCYAAGVEAVAAQAVTADAAAADGLVPIVPLKPVEGKRERALGLATRLGDRDNRATCRVYLLPDADRETAHGRLSEHLARFPHGRFDDPVDATVYAVELAHRGAPQSSGGAPSTGRPR